MAASRDHVQDTGPTGVLGHTGADGSSMGDRISRHMTWEAWIGENIMYSSRTPMQVLCALAIDDGVPSRGHRNNIFSTSAAHSGSYTGSHSRFTS